MRRGNCRKSGTRSQGRRGPESTTCKRQDSGSSASRPDYPAAGRARRRVLQVRRPLRRSNAFSCPDFCPDRHAKPHPGRLACRRVFLQGPAARAENDCLLRRPGRQPHGFRPAERNHGAGGFRRFAARGRKGVCSHRSQVFAPRRNSGNRKLFGASAGGPGSVFHFHAQNAFKTRNFGRKLFCNAQLGRKRRRGPGRPFRPENRRLHRRRNSNMRRAFVQYYRVPGHSRHVCKSDCGAD